MIKFYSLTSSWMRGLCVASTLIAMPSFAAQEEKEEPILIEQSDALFCGSHHRHHRQDRSVRGSYISQLNTSVIGQQVLIAPGQSVPFATTVSDHGVDVDSTRTQFTVTEDGSYAVSFGVGNWNNDVSSAAQLYINSEAVPTTLMWVSTQTGILSSVRVFVSLQKGDIITVRNADTDFPIIWQSGALDEAQLTAYLTIERIGHAFHVQSSSAN